MALDILHDNWGPYTHTEVENALKAYLAVLENRINQAIQSGGVGMADLSAEVQALLYKANTALQPENIAAWAKAQNKPGYTVSEITGVEGFQNLLAKLQDMDAKIQAAAQSGEIPDDEMSSTSEKPVQNKVIKAYVDGLIQGLQNVLNTITQDGATQGVIDTFNEVKAFLEGISSSDTLAAKLATLVPQTRTINGKPLTSNVVIGIDDIEGLATAIAAAGSGAVSISVPDPADGTFTIHVGDDSYTINLNHTHENMAKLVVCEESDLPSTLEADTIYCQVDDSENPGEIEKLWIAGLEFAGGGGGDPLAPTLFSPREGSEIELTNEGSGWTKTVPIRGKNISAPLAISLQDGTYFSIDKQSVSPDSNGTVNTTLTITCSSSDVNVTDSLIISGNTDGILVECDVVSNKMPYTPLVGVKFNGYQWLKTDYVPNNNTALEITFKMTQTSLTKNSSDRFFMRTAIPAGTSNSFLIFPFGEVGSQKWGTIIDTQSSQEKSSGVISSTYFYADNAKIRLENGTCTYTAGGQSFQIGTGIVVPTLSDPITICGRLNNQGQEKIYNYTDVNIYEFKIWESGTLVKHYKPALYQGVIGLYDVVNDDFISSESSTSLIAITQ